MSNHKKAPLKVPEDMSLANLGYQEIELYELKYERDEFVRCATLNFNERWWQIGGASSYPPKHVIDAGWGGGGPLDQNKYSGRGWKQKLVDDAAATILNIGEQK